MPKDHPQITQRTSKSLAKRQLFSSTADELSRTTNFNHEECLALLDVHDHLLYRGKVERGRFRQFLYTAFDLTSDLMMDNLFRTFDRNGDGNIDMVEFVLGLSPMLRGTMEQLTEFCYFVYDMNGDRSLAREELSQCLRGCLQPGYGLEPDEIDDAERDIVEIAMKKLDFNRDGQITMDDFANAVKTDPLLAVSCGEILPNDIVLSRFMFLIAEDHRSFTDGLLGNNFRRYTNIPSRASSIMTGRGRPSVMSSIRPSLMSASRPWTVA